MHTLFIHQNQDVMMMDVSSDRKVAEMPKKRKKKMAKKVGCPVCGKVNNNFI